MVRDQLRQRFLPRRSHPGPAVQRAETLIQSRATRINHPVALLVHVPRFVDMWMDFRMISLCGAGSMRRVLAQPPQRFT